MAVRPSGTARARNLIIMSSEPKDRRAAHMLARVVGAYAGALSARAEKISWMLADARSIRDPRLELTQAAVEAFSLANTARALRFHDVTDAAERLQTAIESLLADDEEARWSEVERAMVQLTRAADPQRAQA